MNAAIFASAFYPSLGGVEELVRQLAHAQQRDGGSPVVLTERWPRSLPPFELHEGIPAYRLPMRVPDGSLKARLTHRLTHPSIRRQTLAVLRRHAPDVLHVQCVSSPTYYALAAKRVLGLPLVVTLQGELAMDAGQLFQRSAFAQSLMRSALEEADAITACSGQTLGEAETFFGRSFGDRGRVVYNGIRLADFTGVRPYEHPRPYILAIGRHVPQKGFDVLLRAFGRVVAEGEESHDLVLAGDGVERESLERLAEDLRLDLRVRFVGRVDRKHASRLFLGCSLFVLPSRHEPMGIVNLEAMAAGKAVVASRVGGVPELVVDRETGLLVPGEDPAALAEALGGLVRNPELREAMGARGRARSERFDWAGLAGEYAAVYHQARSVCERRCTRV